MTRKKQVVPRRHRKRIAHKGRGVERQSAGHAAGDAICGIEGLIVLRGTRGKGLSEPVGWIEQVRDFVGAGWTDR